MTPEYLSTLAALPQLALSVRQPWVHCIFELGKPVENRKWATHYRGPVCVHAAKGMTAKGWCEGFDTAREAALTDASLAGKKFPGQSALVRGGIVGTIDIVDCVTRHESPWFFGPYGFVLANPQPCEFIPVKGALGFFDWRKNLEATP
ncbi:MAG: hypothetical protein JSR13_16770 [Proteobacteria bacterium]|nr:hypothetical protein [Pseudomonadota bacterium]